MIPTITFRTTNLVSAVPYLHFKITSSNHHSMSEFQGSLLGLTWRPNVRSIIVPTAFLLLFASATTVVAQERRGGAIVRSPRVAANISRPARVGGEFRGTRRFGYRARVYGGYYGYGYRPYRYYTAYGYRPYHRYYRSYGYGPVYGYRDDYCDW
jgi:hypothetical protein